MKTVFLISDFPNGLTNDFKHEFAQVSKNYNRFCYIASSFEKTESNERYAKRTYEMFSEAGFTFKELVIIDNRRTLQETEKLLLSADAVFLAGGNTLKQMKSLNEYHIGNVLKKSNAVIMGLSAGAINLAERVVLAKDGSDDIPELSIYQGLGLVNINIEPHLDFSRTEHLKEIEEAAKHSEILGLFDNSFVRVCGEDIRIFGPYHRFF